jgi:hypothetical protein
MADRRASADGAKISGDSWQITPRMLTDALKKIDVAAIEAARRG